MIVNNPPTPAGSLQRERKRPVALPWPVDDRRAGRGPPPAHSRRRARAPRSRGRRACSAASAPPSSGSRRTSRAAPAYRAPSPCAPRKSGAADWRVGGKGDHRDHRIQACGRGVRRPDDLRHGRRAGRQQHGRSSRAPRTSRSRTVEAAPRGWEEAEALEFGIRAKGPGSGEGKGRDPAPFHSSSGGAGVVVVFSCFRTFIIAAMRSRSGRSSTQIQGLARIALDPRPSRGDNHGLRTFPYHSSFIIRR